MKDSLLKFNTWKRGVQRAPHKPLLLLYALGRWSYGQREFTWEEVKANVGELIDRFGGSAQRRPEYPFIRLMNDGIWQVDNVILNASGDMNVSLLNSTNNRARFTPDFEARISDDHVLRSIVVDLVESHFPDSLHEDLLESIQIKEVDEFIITRRKKRDPAFRYAVLDAYDHKCAICGYQIQFNNSWIGIEAAHLQWHNSKGPSAINNGLSLCSIHHKLLDYGAIGLNDNLQILVAADVRGNDLDFWLFRHEGRSIQLPLNSVHEPRIDYIQWQRKEVFKG